LSWYNGKWTRFASPVDSLDWGAIYYNKTDKTYWAGSFGQLIHYDKDLRVINSYTQEDGLIADIITGILPDDNGNIWMQFSRSVSKLNIKTGKIASLSEKDGLIKQPYGFPPVATEGDLYFWGNQGIDRVTPDKLTESYPPSLVYLKSLEINQKPFPLPIGINHLQELLLRYNNNQITIETGIIDYYSKGSNHIRYKLEEINGDWQIAPANYTIRYDGLPPGKYRLVMQASNAANEFNGPEKILLIHINPPFWQTWWFRTLIALAAIGAIYGIYRYRLQQVMHLQNIRNRIAADLHDDIGSTLNSISIYSEVAKKDTAGRTQALEMIGESSRKVIDAMSDIVWTINPDNDSFERIILRMRSLSYNLLRAKQIEFSFRADENLNNLKLSLEERRNFYLIFKEALNNLLKYSNAKRASVLLSKNAGRITLQIRDDGIGFDTKKKYNGNGLVNMQKRAKEINAELHIESGDGIGTITQLTLII
jgi:two-component sensor histidine kinase